MAYVSLFPDSFNDRTRPTAVVPVVKALAYALNSMEGVGCRIVKQNVGKAFPRIQIVVDGSSDTPWPDDGVPPYLAQAATSWPVFGADTEGIAYVLARKDDAHGNQVGWFPITETCLPDTTA